MGNGAGSAAGAGAAHPTVPPAFVKTLARDANPGSGTAASENPSGAVVSKSWQTVGSTVGVLVAALAPATGTATASAAVTTATAATYFLRKRIFN
jgi:hypothetical protein